MDAGGVQVEWTTQEAAAVHIQRVVRGGLARGQKRRRREQQAAALCIQRVHRRGQAREEVRRRREGRRQEQAAGDLQRLYRGHRGRAEAGRRAAQRQKGAAISIQRVYRGSRTRSVREGGARCGGDRPYLPSSQWGYPGWRTELDQGPGLGWTLQ